MFSSLFSSTNTQPSIKIHDPLHLLHHSPTPIPNPHSSSVKRHWNLFQANHIRKKSTRSKHRSCLHRVLYIKLKQCFFFTKKKKHCCLVYLFIFVFHVLRLFFNYILLIYFCLVICIIIFSSGVTMQRMISRVTPVGCRGFYARQHQLYYDQQSAR